MIKTRKERAFEEVHLHAAGGTAYAIVPIPGFTTGGLTAIETHLIYSIANIYGVELEAKDILEIFVKVGGGGLLLKKAALEASNFIPFAGSAIKAAIAGSAIEALGTLVIGYFEITYSSSI